jgi:hypothetical protein
MVQFKQRQKAKLTTVEVKATATEEKRLDQPWSMWLKEPQSRQAIDSHYVLA